MPNMRVPGGYNPNAPERLKFKPIPGERNSDENPFDPGGEGADATPGGGGGDNIDDRGSSEKPREIHPEMPTQPPGQSPSPESQTGPIQMPPINPTPTPKSGQNPNPFYPPDPASLSQPMPMLGGAGGLLGGGMGVPGRLTDNRPPTDLLMMLSRLINGGQ